MMKSILQGVLLLAAGTLAAGQTLSLTFDKAQKLSFGKTTVEIPAGNAEGYLVCGKQGVSIPAATLVGEQGSILFQFRQDEPLEEKNTNRFLFTLRCSSRMRTGLYLTPGSNVFRFHFGDMAGQIYHPVKETFQYGKTYWAGIVWNGMRVQFYMDGKLIGDYKQPVRMEKVSMLNLGPFKDGWMVPKPWGGDTLFKAVKVFNTALTSAEVAEACSIALKSASQRYPGTLSVPIHAGTGPQINGELKEEFWKHAASLPVLTRLGKPLESFRAPGGKFLISADSKYLYLGFSYGIPAGNTVNAGGLRTKDSEPEVWGTESFELYLLVNGNLYRFAGNAAGGYTEWKNNGVEWTAPWTYKTQMKMLIDNSSVWQGEAAIPWSSLGLNGIPAKPLQFNFCRTWCLPDYSGATSVLPDGAYTRSEDFLTLAFDRKAPAAQTEYRNDPSKGVFRQNVTLYSPVANQLTYEVALLKKDGSSEPFVLTEKNVTLKSGEVRELELDAKITTTAYDAIRYSLKDGRQVYARTTVPFHLNEVYLDVRPRFLAGQLDFDIQTALLKGKFGADCKVILCVTAPDGKEIFRAPVTQDEMTVPFDRKNPAGNYTAKILDGNGKNLSQRILHFPGIGAWEKAVFDPAVILPPFTPLTVKGSAYSMWGRTYQYDKSLFPTQIQSQGVSMLSGPCGVFADGREISRGTWIPGSVKNYRAEFKGSAANPDCRITADSWVEYDGVSYSKFQLHAEKNLKDVKLVFTLPASLVKYLHTSIGGSWGAKLTRPVKEGTFRFGFFPMVWLGMEDKGICFFTETRNGWTGSKDAVFTIRKDAENAVLEVALRKELKAGETFDFEFGYVATPVKPLPKNYPFNMVGDQHTQLMRRPGHAPVNYLTIVGAPYPHEIESYFGDLPNEKESPAVPHYRKMLGIRDLAGNKSAVYMDARYLSDEYPEVAAFKDEWKFSPERTLDYTRDGKKYTLYDCCPASGANAFFHLRQKRCLERFRFDGVYYDFGTFGVCSNALHGCRERWPILATREFYRRTALGLYQLGHQEPLIILHNTDSVQVPAITFVTHLFNGEHIRQSSSTIMHNGKDIQDSYDLEMFASELGSLPFGITNSVYQSNDVLLPKFGGGKEDPDLYKFRITQAFLAGVLPHHTMLAQSRCHYGILDKIVRFYERFGVFQARFIGYWEKPAEVKGAKDIYVSVYARPEKKKALAVISHIGKSHENQAFEVIFDRRKLGFTPTKAVDLMNAPDPEYAELPKLHRKANVQISRAPLKLGDFGSKLDGIQNGVLKMSLKFHTFALVELSE